MLDWPWRLVWSPAGCGGARGGGAWAIEEDELRGAVGERVSNTTLAAL